MLEPLSYHYCFTHALLLLCSCFTAALAHCHKRGLVHCDIKCENILFASRAADSELKIADFGLAQLLQRGDKLMAGRGTPEYVAPEVIESTGYDTSADMWSVGVLIYTWMSGVFPFTVSEKEKIAKTQNSKDTENLTTEHLTRARDAHRDLLYTKISECTYSEANLDKVPPTYAQKKKSQPLTELLSYH